MRKALALFLATTVLCLQALAQTTAPAEQQKQGDDEDVVRITSQLIQVDAVVADKNDQVIPDLKLSDFSLYENGKRQELKFVEFVGADSKARVDGNVAAAVSGDSDIARNLSATEVHRVFAFIVDD